MHTTGKATHRVGKSVRVVVSGQSRYALLEGDCLELMPRVPPGTVDLILTDLPYGMSALLAFLHGTRPGLDLRPAMSDRVSSCSHKMASILASMGRSYVGSKTGCDLKPQPAEG